MYTTGTTPTTTSADASRYRRIPDTCRQGTVNNVMSSNN